MKRAPWLLCLALLAAPGLYGEDRDARLVEREGEVWLKTPDSQWEKIPEDLSSMPLETGDAVRTGAGSLATLQLDAANVLELDEKSEFTLTSLALAYTRLKLSAGRLFARIEEKLEANRRQMEVEVPQAVIAVQGTEFVAEARETTAEGEGGVAVFEGDVGVKWQGNAQTPSLRIAKDQEIVFGLGKDLPAVGPLRRFQGRRARMALVRKRLARLRVRWKTLSPERRRIIRGRIHLQRQKSQQRRRRRR
jgi:hypothetical protein